MNFAPLWKAYLAGEMDFFQIAALSPGFSHDYLRRKFARYMEREGVARRYGRR